MARYITFCPVFFFTSLWRWLATRALGGVSLKINPYHQLPHHHSNLYPKFPRVMLDAPGPGSATGIRGRAGTRRGQPRAPCRVPEPAAPRPAGGPRRIRPGRGVRQLRQPPLFPGPPQGRVAEGARGVLCHLQQRSTLRRHSETPLSNRRRNSEKNRQRGKRWVILENRLCDCNVDDLDFRSFRSFRAITFTFSVSIIQCSLSSPSMAISDTG